MIPDATFEPVPPQSKLRLRFSLLALLVFVTLICFGLAWLVRPNLVVATALFQVDSIVPTILSDEPQQSRNQQKFEIVKKTQMALLKSYFVLNAAVRDPGISSLPLLGSQQDPVEWLQDHVAVEFPQNSEILAISIRGSKESAEDLVRIVDAVAKAYLDEVIYAERQRRLATRDLIARSLESLNRELQRKFEELLDIAREGGRLESGSGGLLQEIDMKRLDRIETELMRLESEALQAQAAGNSENATPIEKRLDQLRKRQQELEQKIMARAEVSVELTTRQRELDQLQRIANALSLRLETMDIEANAPDRIRQIQQAVVSPMK